MAQADDASEGGWSALHVAGIYNSAISAAAAIDGKGDVFQRDVYGYFCNFYQGT